MQVGAHDHAIARTRFDVDVRKDAALANKPELWKPIEKRSPYRGALAYEHQRIGVAQPGCQGVLVLDVIGPDINLMTFELVEAPQRSERVKPIIEDRDFHSARR